MLDRDFYRPFEPRSWHEWMVKQEQLDRTASGRETRGRARRRERDMEDEW